MWLSCLNRKMETELSNPAITAVTGVLLAFTCVIFLGYVFKRKSPATNGKKMPMLPSLPIVGSLPFMPGYPKLHTFFLDKSRTMGNVIGLYMGSQFAVVLNGRQAITDGLAKKSDLAGRPKMYSRTMWFNPEYRGIGEHQYDDHYKKYHQLALSILKDFGFGKPIMQIRIQQEVQLLMEAIGKLNGSPFYPEQVVKAAVFNVISSIVFNNRFTDLNHPDCNRWIKLVGLYLEKYYDFMAADFFTTLLHLPYFRNLLEQNIKHNQEIMKKIEEAIVHALVNRGNGESFVTSFIDREGDINYDYQQLKYTVRDFILGGTDTTASTTLWFLICMADNPDVQNKARAEIEHWTKGRDVTLEDERSMPYMQAVLWEVMRRYTLGPLGGPHYSLKDTEVLGYFIPRDTMVITNLYSCHMDPDIFPSPEKFKPERFLDEDGNLTGKDKLLQFSIGKRSCIGEQLARQELFLFTTGLLINFNIKPPEGVSKIDAKENTALTNPPAAFDIRLLPRTSFQNCDVNSF